MSVEESGAEAPLAIAQAITLLSAELFLDLPASESGDLVFSPFCLSSALAVVKLASAGTTTGEISQALHFPLDDELVRKEFSNVLTNLLEDTNETDFIFYTDNKLFLPACHEIDGKVVNLSLKPEFSKIADTFGIEVLPINFEDCKTVAEINASVESNTIGKIEDILSLDVVNANCKIALISGVYFKGEWKYKFDERSTRSSEFHLSEEETFMVDMMHVRNDSIPYQLYDDLDAQAVTLPFKGDLLSMVVFVPLQIDGLNKIEKGLRKLARKGVSSTKYIPKFECRVRVYLPRFRIESSLEFTEALQNLGINSIFNPGEVDFGGMLNEPEVGELQVSHVIQKVVIEVDEGGSKAAPARSMSSSSSFGSDTRKPTTSYFIADRPFLFQIIDNSSDVVILSGKCSRPEFD